MSSQGLLYYTILPFSPKCDRPSDYQAPPPPKFENDLKMDTISNLGGGTLNLNINVIFQRRSKGEAEGAKIGIVREECT